MIDTIEKYINHAVDMVGSITGVFLVLMVLNISFDVMMRYVFHNSSVAMQEMEWHLFSIIFLFGISVTLKDEGHVRVDFLYERFSPKVKAIINITGTLLFLIPLSMLICYASFEFVQDAWVSNEISGDPGGLPYRWLIKAMIPLSFSFLILTSIGYILQNIKLYKRGK